MIEKKGLAKASTTKKDFYGKTISKTTSNKVVGPIKVPSGKGRSLYGKVT